MKLMTFERLEPYEVKVSSTVLRREGKSNLSDLSDCGSVSWFVSSESFRFKLWLVCLGGIFRFRSALEHYRQFRNIKFGLEVTLG